MKVVKPPERLSIPGALSTFLAGSIEMGAAEDWQTYVENELKDVDGVIYNPRRDDWDSSWEQSIDNPQFNEQVTWELDYLDRCIVPFFYFQPGTQSPISLMELGISCMRVGYLPIVVCPDGFWRKGNVDILCKRNSMKVFTDLDSGINALKRTLEHPKYIGD